MRRLELHLRRTLEHQVGIWCSRSAQWIERNVGIDTLELLLGEACACFEPPTGWCEPAERLHGAERYPTSSLRSACQ